MVQKRHEKWKPCLGNIMSGGIQKKRMKVHPLSKSELQRNLERNNMNLHCKSLALSLKVWKSCDNISPTRRQTNYSRLCASEKYIRYKHRMNVRTSPGYWFSITTDWYISRNCGTVILGNTQRWCITKASSLKYTQYLEALQTRLFSSYTSLLTCETPMYQ